MISNLHTVQDLDDDNHLTPTEAATLTETAYGIAIATLEKHKNQLHANHKAALKALIGARLPWRQATCKVGGRSEYKPA